MHSFCGSAACDPATLTAGATAGGGAAADLLDAAATGTGRSAAAAALLAAALLLGCVLVRRIRDLPTLHNCKLGTRVRRGVPTWGGDV